MAPGRRACRIPRDPVPVPAVQKLRTLDLGLERLEQRLLQFDVTMRAQRLTTLDSRLYALEYRAHALDFRMRLLRMDLLRCALDDDWIYFFET